MEKVKLLYVDDEDVNLRLFSIVFSRKYHVITADSASKGLAILKDETDIDLVISDMKMPYVSGVEFIREAKEIYPDKLFFILTGFEVNNEINQALDEGLILRCFRKPINKEEIENEISKAIDTNAN